MIRINLSPSAKRRAQPGRKTAVQSMVPDTQVSKGALIAIGMLVGWVALGVVGYLVLGTIAEDTQAFKNDSTKINKQAGEINAEIDEEGLQSRFDRYTELKATEKALEKKRRTPVFVYFELANILTSGKGPDIDQAEYKKRRLIDPDALLDPNWDPQSVWITQLRDEGSNVIEIVGGTRDPDDLSEFVKGLRASARFSRISHPQYKLEEVDDRDAVSIKVKSAKPVKPGESDRDYYVFELTAQVRYWD